MAKARSARRAEAVRTRSSELLLGAGLHPGHVERILSVPPVYQVRLGDGRQIVATLAPGVEPSFVEECLREGRAVVLMDGASGAVIAGALQTATMPRADARGTLALEARHIRLRATETLELEVPGSNLRMEPGGAVRIDGDKLVIDMAALMRVFAGRVELP